MRDEQDHGCGRHETPASIIAMIGPESGATALSLAGQALPPRRSSPNFIWPDVPHRFGNASATQPMNILWIDGTSEATRILTGTCVTNLVALEHR